MQRRNRQREIKKLRKKKRLDRLTRRWKMALWIIVVVLFAMEFGLELIDIFKL